KIRLRLLPFLTETFGGSTENAILRLSAHAAEDKEYFSALVGDAVNAYAKMPDTEAGGAINIVFPLTVLRDFHPAVRHRLVVALFAKIGLAQDIEAAHLKAADALLERSETGKSVDFPGGYRFEISYANVVFSRVMPGGSGSRGAVRSGAVRSGVVRVTEDEENNGNSREALSHSEELPDNTESANKKNRSAAVAFDEMDNYRNDRKARPDLETLSNPLPVADEVGITEYEDENGRKIIEARCGGKAARFDAEALAAAKLVPAWRTRLPGDIMRPKGMDGTKKLQDIFVDKKIPRSERDSLLLFAAGREVLWIPEIRISRMFAL
ncbi:MAG: tRNA lysidine(34) synthetase TilS, partial [Clostridiales Family XIII bacterium]|nr:tRNA lysidine(34) synthetase TilS [Clostridiales Family XIII bacterium]